MVGRPTVGDVVRRGKRGERHAAGDQAGSLLGWGVRFGLDVHGRLAGVAGYGAA